MKENNSITKTNASSDAHEIAYANTREKPNHLHNNYTVKVRRSANAERGLGKRKWIMGKRPDVRTLSKQFDGPDTFWGCSYCYKELDTLVALTAHVDVVH